MEVVSCFTYLLILKVFCYEKCKEFWRIVVKVFCLVLLFIFYIGCEADIDIQENVNDATNANF